MSQLRSKSIIEFPPCVIYHEAVKDEFDMGIFVPKSKLSTQIKTAVSYNLLCDVKEYDDNNKSFIFI